MKKESKRIAYKYSLFMMLGLTKFISSIDYSLPTKWYSIIDSVRVSTGVLHDRISTIDWEVEQEFREKEEMIDRRLGKKKFYSEDELDQIQDKIKEIQV
jgi:hypothetical protein